MKSSRIVAHAFAAACLLGSAAALAQDDEAPAQAGAQQGAPQGGTQTTTQQIYLSPFGFPPGGADINQNLPSSSRPSLDTGTASDGFDLNQPSADQPTVYRGEKGAQGVLPDESRAPTAQLPPMHTVRRGDTLWDLSGRYYQNPYTWPRVWSFNPHIENPHWIYPGDQVRMRDAADGGRGGVGGGASRGFNQSSMAGGTGTGGFLNRRSSVPDNTVFLRSQGFLGDPKKDVWGELVGAREEQMLLSEGNNVYMIMRPGADVRVGQNLTIFKSVRQPEKVTGARKPPGEIVAVKGTVRIDKYDPKTRIARGRITESVDVIERGAKIGPVGRRLDVVPPRPNEADLWARVLTGIYPHVYMAQNQVVFIDRGSADGLQPGNRLLVVSKGDSWRRGLKTATKMARERVLMDSPKNVETEQTPLHGDDEQFPEEIIGELRVLRTEKYSSIALVTASSREIGAGDRAVARKGY